MFVDRLRRGVQSQSLEDTADQLQELYNTIHTMVTTHPTFAGERGMRCASAECSRKDLGVGKLLDHTFAVTCFSQISKNCHLADCIIFVVQT